MEIRSMNMQSNVPVAVNNSENYTSNIIETDVEIANLDQAPEDGVRAVKSELIESEDGTVSFPDRILESAKEEGFEEALTHLADGDFDETDEDAEPVMTEEDSEPAEIEDKKIDEDEKIVEYSEQITILEGKVEDLENKNKDLFERLSNVEDRQNLSAQAMLETILLLKALAEEEEDDKKKADILSTVLQFMENLIIMMFVPESEESLKNKNSKDSKSSHNSPLKDNVINFLDAVKKKELQKKQRQAKPASDYQLAA